MRVFKKSTGPRGSMIRSRSAPAMDPKRRLHDTINALNRIKKTQCSDSSGTVPAKESAGRFVQSRTQKKLSTSPQTRQRMLSPQSDSSRGCTSWLAGIRRRKRASGVNLVTIATPSPLVSRHADRSRRRPDYRRTSRRSTMIRGASHDVEQRPAGLLPATIPAISP